MSHPNTALLIVDVQRGMYSDPKDPVFEGERLLHTIQNLIRKARSAPIPIIFIQHNGKPGSMLDPKSPNWEIHPALNPQQEDLRISKNYISAFQETPLHEELQVHKISELVICGIQSELCVDTASRHGSILGYRITLVSDGHSTFNTPVLAAEKIIAHHNHTLKDWFVTLKSEAEIKFSSEAGM